MENPQIRGPGAEVGQQPAASLPGEGWDAVVVGAGPAGSTAAIHLAARGHRVLLVDRAQFPRDKVCGDGLLPDSLRCIERAGLDAAVRAEARAIERATIVSPSGTEFDLPGTYVTLRRRTLDFLLVREAVRRGAAFACGEVTGVAEGDGFVACTASSSGRPFRAAFAVLATGTRVGLLKQLSAVTVERPNATAVRCYVRSSAELNRIILFYERSILPAYAWISPVGRGEYNVGCGIIRRGRGWTVNLREVFRRFCEEFAPARDLLRQGEMISPLRGAPLRWGLTGSRPLCGTRVLAVGDAIGATLPFSGEGVGMAMETGERAAEAVHDALASGDVGRLRDFEAGLERSLRPQYQAYEAAQRWLAHPALVDFVARRARRSRFLRESFAGIYAGTAKPQKAFSLWGILQSFWK